MYISLLLWIVTPPEARLDAPTTSTCTHVPAQPLSPGTVYRLGLVVKGAALSLVTPLQKQVIAPLQNKCNSSATE